MTVEISIVCSDCRERCSTVISGRCLWCAYAAWVAEHIDELEPDRLLPGVRISIAPVPDRKEIAP